MEKSLLSSQKIFEFDESILNTSFDASLLKCREKFDCIIGIDEAGRGPAAGPLYVAAVSFFNIQHAKGNLFGLNDSKKLTEKTREKLFPTIKNEAFFSICSIEIEDIERMNILGATLFGMKNAALDVIKKCNAKKPLILVDGNKPLKDFNYLQKTIVHGDATSASIAAASVLAKVSRDNFMLELDKKFPLYNFKKNKGYLTKEHIEAIRTNGVCTEHRQSFLKKITK